MLDEIKMHDSLLKMQTLFIFKGLQEIAFKSKLWTYLKYKITYLKHKIWAYLKYKIWAEKKVFQ